MSEATNWGPTSVWHHRLLGGFWALCALFMIGSALLSGHWVEYQFWIALPFAAAWVATGIGFMFARRWARRTMAVLMLAAALFFLDMFLMFAVHSHRLAMWGMLAGFGIVIYTWAFLLISAAWHSYGSP